ncbi:MAG TPA: aldo/keto reductase, partial [Pirellulaceae bacterium]|nr:aldo/keto reductase [Pirellulaceae bacterium]
MPELRRLGLTDIFVSPVALGCWPIAGMTSLGTSEADSLATVAACFDLGVNFLDTAYCYGSDGQSERLIARAVRGRRDQVVIATKCGIHWGPSGERVIDGRRETLHRQCETSLQRLETDRVELLYLHAPDPKTPVAESAAALKELLDAGKTRSVGVSNFSVEQLAEFHAVCPISAFQPPYNMLQRQIERDTLPWCRERGVSVAVYWPLLKGLLAGRLPRDHVFQPGDGRPKYPMFQGDEWQRNQDFIDVLRAMSNECGRSVADIVVNWTIHQPGITSALCGAKRPDQLRDTAVAMNWKLTDAQFARIEAA